jgi:ubiquinone/menaquinone biosynthesis C-methylase UbiE
MAEVEKDILASLPVAERAKQLGRPEGKIGLAVAERLNDTNRQGNLRAVEMLRLEAGHHVLEIGFGNGRTVPDVIAQAENVRYAGIDISSTMVDEAARFNAGLVAAGRASFHLGSAERMPFADASFDRAFSNGVVHFWENPAGPLTEVRRVLRPGGISQMTCLYPRNAPDFARPEYGVYLRDDADWDALYRAGGFSEFSSDLVALEMTDSEGKSTTRYAIYLTARRSQ